MCNSDPRQVDLAFTPYFFCNSFLRFVTHFWLNFHSYRLHGVPVFGVNLRGISGVNQLGIGCDCSKSLYNPFLIVRQFRHNSNHAIEMKNKTLNNCNIFNTLKIRLGASENGTGNPVFVFTAPA